MFEERQNIIPVLVTIPVPVTKESRPVNRDDINRYLVWYGNEMRQLICRISSSTGNAISEAFDIVSGNVNPTSQNNNFRFFRHNVTKTQQK